MNLQTLKMILPTAVYDEAVRKYEQARTRRCNDDPFTGGAANLERPACHGPIYQKAGARFHSPVCICIHSFRKRLADPDGISAKAAIDGLRNCGILCDDTLEQIKEVTYKQTKIDKDEDEYTLIHILPTEKEVTIR